MITRTHAKQKYRNDVFDSFTTVSLYLEKSRNVIMQDNKQIEDVTYVQQVEENGPKKSLP